MSFAYIEHLFNPLSSLSIASDELTRVTVDLILLHLTCAVLFMHSVTFMNVYPQCSPSCPGLRSYRAGS